jgi:hypothetical protein
MNKIIVAVIVSPLRRHGPLRELRGLPSPFS